MYCHRFPTPACVTGNGRVRSPEDNKAPSAASGISGDREVKTKTVSLLRWEEAERMVCVTYVNHFKPRYPIRQATGQALERRKRLSPICFCMAVGTAVVKKRQGVGLSGSCTHDTQFLSKLLDRKFPRGNGGR